jgi:uncharacterized OB-fold protein
MTVVEPLSAPIELRFDYTRSLGSTLGAFMTALAGGRIVGARASDFRVYVPPLHAVDVAGSESIAGTRVRARWRPARVGAITDIECFELAAGASPTHDRVDVEDVTITTTPVELTVQHSASFEETRYLLGLEQGQLLGQRCPQCGKVYIPPRAACPVDGVPTVESVELPDHGVVTTFCIVNVPFYGQKIKPPYVAAYVLLDGADIAFLHLILGCPADEVRMGMRVEAVWKPRDEWGPALANIDHFRPTGEPDADYESYKDHL